MWRSLGFVAVLLLAGVTGCGDEETNDKRGYTKAPLERPGVRIVPEGRSDMNRLGEPIRPRGEAVSTGGT
jgi:hypothetical protein